MKDQIHPVIMPTRNCLPLTQKAITSVKAQTIPTELLVIDNGSTDGTPQWLWANGIQYVSLPSASVSGMWNAGVRWAFTLADYCLVINNDVELIPETYERLLSHGGQFVTGVGVSEKDKFKSTQRVNKKAGELGMTWNIAERPHPDFSCFLIRSSAFDKVGPFDEAFQGAYAEDLDYHVRMHRAGVKAVCINLPFLHHAAGTLKSASKVDQVRIQKQADKNRAYFKQKWGATPATSEYDALFTSNVAAVEALACKT